MLLEAVDLDHSAGQIGILGPCQYVPWLTLGAHSGPLPLALFPTELKVLLPGTFTGNKTRSDRTLGLLT